MGTKVTDLTELTATAASGDFLHIIDVSDTSGGSAGTSKKILISNLPTGSGGTTSVITVRNNTGSSIAKGKAVYITGIISSTPTIALSDNSSASTMPAIGITQDAIADGADGSVVIFGELDTLDTSGFSASDTLYVGTSGDLVNTRPSGTALVQNIGACLKVSASTGSILIEGAGRTNDVPNIPNGQAWIGNASGVATPTTLATVATSGDYADLSNTPNANELTGIYLEYITRDSAYGASSYEGEVVKFGTGTLVSNKVFVFTSSGWVEADATLESKTKGLFGIALGTSPTTDGLLVKGFRAYSNAFTAGDVLYISTTSGTITNTAPSGSGQFVRVIGYAMSTSIIYVAPSQDWIELA